MKRLIIIQNICFIEKYYSKFDEIIYAPTYHSYSQKKFTETRFKEIKKSFPKITSTQDFEFKQTDEILTWNAFQEKKKYGESLIHEKNLLFDELPFNIPDSFTQFRKKIEPILPELYENTFKPKDSDLVDHLNYYFIKNTFPSTYFQTRNALTGKNYSTKMSPFLSHGVIDVKYLYNEIKKYESTHGANKSTYWLVFELLWREFFYWHYQKHTKKYFSKNGLKGTLDFSSFKKFEIDELFTLSHNSFFHAALNELTETGFLSNRVRQMFASFWINDLKLEWRSGAHLFETNLIDYDVFSNYGNWMYLAGVGVDPRGRRYFHIDKQLKNYDPQNLYLNNWSKR